MKLHALLAVFTLAAVTDCSAAPLVYGDYYDEATSGFCSSGGICRLKREHKLLQL